MWWGAARAPALGSAGKGRAGPGKGGPARRVARPHRQSRKREEGTLKMRL